MARRKNAIFTLDKTYGAGHGDRSLIQAFYRKLNALYPGNTPIPIPPESQVHPQHEAKTQLFIFVDYAVCKIAPLAFRGAGLKVQGAKLEQLKPITDEKTALAAAAATSDAYRAASAAHGGNYDSDAARAASAANAANAAAEYVAYNVGIDRVAACAANAANAAAELDPDATWAVVNEMLQALSTSKFAQPAAKQPAAKQPAAKPQIVTPSFGNIDFSKLDFTKLKF